MLVLPRQCCFEITLPKMSPLIRLHHRSSLIIPSPPSAIKAPAGTPCLATSSNAATAASFNQFSTDLGILTVNRP